MAKTDDALTEAPPKPLGSPPAEPRRWEPPGRLLLLELAMLSGGAGAIHLAVAADHFNYHWTHGSFFVAAGIAQVAWAVLIVAFPRRLFLFAGIAGNGLMIATWAMSRMFGAPLGPEPWVPETIGIADGLATGLEILLVTELFAVVAGRGYAPAQARSLARFAPFAAVIMVLTAGGIVSASIGGHSHGGAEEMAAGADHHSGTPIEDDDPLLAEMTAAVDQRGTTAGLDVLERAVAEDPALDGMAHQYVHALGRYVYNTMPDASKAFASCDDRFASGCFHGVLQGYFEENADFTGPEVAQLCSGPLATETTPALQFQCLHGLGHGLTLFFDHNLLRPLRYCDFLDTRWSRSSCYGGVFMENLIWAQSPEVTTSGLEGESVIEGDLHYPCNAVAPKYQADCYFFQSSVMLHLNGYDFGGAFRECDRAPAAYRDLCYQSMGRDVDGYTNHNPAESLQYCQLGDPARLGECAFGVAQAMVNVQARTDEAFGFCALVPENGQERCYVGIGEWIASLFNLRAERKAECAKAADPEWIAVCERAATVRGPRIEVIPQV